MLSFQKKIRPDTLEFCFDTLLDHNEHVTKNSKGDMYPLIAFLTFIVRLLSQSSHMIRLSMANKNKSVINF